jgi:hypothetical protein
MHRIQFGIGHVVVDDRDPAVAPQLHRKRAQHHAVVRAVDAGLHQHQVPDAMRPGHRLDLRQRPIDRLVVSAAHCCQRIEDVDVAIPASVRA